MLASRYLPYWGPVRVAGAEVPLVTGHEAYLRVPCDGWYRAHAGSPIELDGRSVGDGDVVELKGEHAYRVTAADPAALPSQVRFIWNAARPPPVEAPPRMPLYGH
jgi:hypothetical protein